MYLARNPNESSGFPTFDDGGWAGQPEASLLRILRIRGSGGNGTGVLGPLRSGWRNSGVVWRVPMGFIWDIIYIYIYIHII